jgi:hypothetical protein
MQSDRTMHGLADYYGALDILCEMVGWGSFKNKLYPQDEINSWVKRRSGAVNATKPSDCGGGGVR